MNEELISQYVDRAAIQADTDFVIAQLKILKENFDIIAAQKIKINTAQSVGDLSAALGKVKDAQDKVADSSSKLADASARIQTANAKAAVSYDNLTTATKKTAAAQGDSSKSAIDAVTAFDKIARQLAENQIASDKLREEQRDLKLSYDSGTTTLEKYQEKLTEIKTAQQEIKISNQDLTRSFNALERQSQAATGSLNEMRTQLIVAKQAYDKLSGAEQNAEGGQALKSQIEALDAAVSKLEQDTGRFQRNVGNYSGAFQKAFDVLKQQLTSVKSELGDIETKGKAVVNNLSGGNPIGFDPNKFKGQITSLAKAGGGSLLVAPEDVPVVQQLTNKAQVLENAVGRLAVGFKTTRQEERAFKEAAVEVGLALGQESDEFIVLNEAIGHGLNGINDIKAATKFQASDAKLITGLADAASTLAGAFGAAQAASALFAGENEDLQKQMAKFQQLLVLINGLQAVANGLQAESGGIQLLLSARANLLNAAKAVQLLLTTRAIQAVAAEAVAQEAAAVATGEAVVAEEAQTVALVENTVAMEANAAATVVAGTATKGLSTALIAGGIATLAIAAGVALALLTAKLIGYGQQAGITAEQQKQIAEATKELTDALDAQAKVFDDLDSSQKRYYANLIANAQAAGASQYEVLLAQQRSDKAQADAAQAEIERLGATDAAYSKAANNLQRLQNEQEAYTQIILDLNKIPEKDQTSAQKSQLKAAQANLDLNKTQQANAQKTFDNMTKARKDFADFTQKANEDDIRFNKLALDDQLAAVERAETLRANLIKAKNAVILGADKSTLQDRLTALESNLAQETAILNAQAAKIRANPSNKVNGQLTPEAQGQIDTINEQRKEAEIKSQEDIAKVKADYEKKDRDAAASIYQLELQDRIKANEVIVDNDKNSYGKRLDAESAAESDRRAVIVSQYYNELADQSLTDEQRKAILAKTNSALLDAQRNHEAKVREIIKQNQEKILSDALAFAALRQAQINTDEAQSLQALNESFQGGIESTESYERRRKEIQDKYQIQRLQAQITADTALVSLTEAGTQKRAEAEEKLSKDVLALSQLTVDKQIAEQKRLADAVKEAFNAVQDAIFAALEGGIDSQKNKIQQQIDLITKQKDAAIDAENATGDAAQLKADKIAAINAKAQADQDRLALRQKQLDIQKAKFERAKSIAEIIEKTAVAVAAALPDIPLSILAGVIGAAQLAAVLATPIPQYKYGTGPDGHPGGPAIVGDGGRSEPIILPGGNVLMSPSTSTLIPDLPRGSIVMPDLEALRYDLVKMSLRNAPVYRGEYRDTGTAEAIAGLRSELRQLQQEIRNKPVAVVHNTYAGVQASFQSAQRRAQWLNRNLQS